MGADTAAGDMKEAGMAAEVPVIIGEPTEDTGRAEVLVMEPLGDLGVLARIRAMKRTIAFVPQEIIFATGILRKPGLRWKE